MKKLIDLPVGALIIVTATGVAFRKISTHRNDFITGGTLPIDTNSWAVHANSALGWGSTGSASYAELERLESQTNDGSAVVVFGA